MASQVCFNWRDSGDCKFGSNCRFFHDGQETRGSVRKATQICYTFRDTGKCEYGADCRFSHDLTIKEEKKEVAPKRKKKRAPRKAAGGPVDVSDDRLDCHKFKETGECDFGENCRFLHGGQATRGSRRKTTEPCFALREQGSCKFGDACRYSHDPEVVEAAAPAGGRVEQKDQVCFTFKETGDCRYGDKCRFSHEE